MAPKGMLLPPVSVSVPLPSLVRLPVPLMVPENVVELLSPPADKIPEPPSVTVPAPASEPMVSAPLTVRMAPDATVTALASPIAEPPDATSVPAETVVAPL